MMNNNDMPKALRDLIKELENSDGAETKIVKVKQQHVASMPVVWMLAIIGACFGVSMGGTVALVLYLLK